MRPSYPYHSLPHNYMVAMAIRLGYKPFCANFIAPTEKHLTISANGSYIGSVCLGLQ